MSIEQYKEELSLVLNQIVSYQHEITNCHEYYLSLEKELERKKEHNNNPLDYESLNREIEELSKEYEAKSDIFFIGLNPLLTHGYELASKIGHEVAHDYKKLWDYMTNPIREEVILDHVIRDAEYIKKYLF